LLSFARTFYTASTQLHFGLRGLAAGKPFSQPYSMNLAGIVHAACYKLLFLQGRASNIGFCPSSLKGILVVDKPQNFEKHVWRL